MKTTKRRIGLLPVMALALALSPTLAQAEGMNYQGRLTDNAGAALTAGSATLEFNIWNDPTSDNAANRIWGPFTINADLLGGRFNVVLGPLDAANPNRDIAVALNNFGGAYIHVTVTPQGGTTNADLPRQQIFAAPRALSANLAQHAITAVTAANFTSQVLKTDEENLRVGIGTSSPEEELHVKGEGSVIALEGEIRAYMEFLRSGRVDSVFGYTAISNLFQLANYRGDVNISAAGDLTLNATGDILLDADGSANVGVRTNTPQRELHVKGEAGTIALEGTTHTFLEFYPKTFAAGRKAYLGFGDGSSDKFTLQSDDDIGITSGGNIALSGNVGIGTSSPTVKLDVVGSTSITMEDKKYRSNRWDGLPGNSSVKRDVEQVESSDLSIDVFGMNGTYQLGTGYDAQAKVGILSDGWIASARGFIAFSDQRIKKDIQSSETPDDLSVIKQLRVTDYRMVDPADGGKVLRKGFIAQEVEKVIPGAVTRNVEFVPDVFKVATALSYDREAKTLTLTLPEDHDLKPSERVRLHMDGERVDLEVSAVPSAREFVVKECDKNPKKVLVYGRQVEDFRTVDYDRIFTTTVGAVQELASKVETHELEIAALKQQLAAQTVKDAQQDEQLAALIHLIKSRPVAVTANTVSAAQ